jgi:tetratricopeptide (TPR) repeat protein
MLLLAPALGGQQTESRQPEGATLRGVVNDSAGKVVADARVILRGGSPAVSRQATTDAAGHFTFKGVATGAFTLTSNWGTLRSSTVAVTVTTLGELPPVSLVLAVSDSQQTAFSPANMDQSMQFADKPDFAIAAVTDWTAAGGHGSDASLRTSEALTRDAVKLGAGDGQPAGAGSPELELAEALKTTGGAVEARDHVRQLLARRETADLHRVEGELDEKLGDPFSAAHEFQLATGMDPSEVNFFAWGSELLIHRAVWQAKEVFDEGAKRYPQSARMLTARGAALFAGALYDDAALDLCRASDLNPDSAEPYMFMGKIEIAAPNPLPCVVEKLARFQKLQPTNPLANYYYAMALKKEQGHDSDPRVMEQVKELLTKAVTLDPKCADGYLELGNLSAGDKQWEQAIGHYLNAIQADPELSDAHYRLGVAYQRTGDQVRAREQFKLHDEIASRQAAEIQRQREAVKQFLVVLPNQMGTQQAK